MLKKKAYSTPPDFLANFSLKQYSLNEEGSRVYITLLLFYFLATNGEIK